MFNMFKKETKSEKTEKKSNSSTTTNTHTNGTSFTTSFSHNKTESSTTTSQANTTQVMQKQLLNYRNDPQCSSRRTYTEQITYKGAPPRSAFTSTPLTIKSAAFPGRTTVDAKVFALPVTAPKLPAQNLLGNINAVSNSTPASELQIKLQIKVEKSTKFYDDQKSHVPVYKTRSKRRGKLLLINNIKFLNGKEVRKGAELDESNTIELFKQIGFEVEKSRNLSKQALMNKVTSFRKDKSLSKCDIAAVIIMSHGAGKERSDSTEVVCTDGEPLPTTWIISEFDNTKCPQLNGKPKIFIFQCCRGDQWDIQYDALPPKESRLLSDMLIAYATIPGFVAHRNPVLGTWYIQAICNVFMQHAHNTDVENLLKIVDAKLASLVADYGLKQTSSFENRGFKTCYLHPKLWE